MVCDDQKATDWIGEFFSCTQFMAQAQATMVRAFGLGTGAWGLWVDLDRKKVRVRHYDALINEVDVSKMRVFLSDVLFDREKSADKAISIPFGKQDCTAFRKVMSTEDTIQVFAPALRTSSQSGAFRIALQMLGDLCGFGLGYFDFDESHGYVRTATEVPSDNSALMRNIRRHENALERAITGIAKAVMGVSRSFVRASLKRVPCACSTTTQSSRIPPPRRSRTCVRWASPWRPGSTVPSGMARTRRRLRHERRSWARKARLLRCERTNVNAAEQQSVSMLLYISFHPSSIDMRRSRACRVM